MKQGVWSRIADYLPPSIAFGAALAGLIGAPKWDDHAIGLSKLTTLGWLFVSIGMAALLSSLLVIRRNHTNHATQAATRKRIEAIGRDQLLRGLTHALSVFKNYSLWASTLGEPTSPVDLLDAGRRAILADLNLNSESNYWDGKYHPKWWEMFENTADAGATQITASLQIYVTFLDPRLIEVATRFLNCEFMHRLRNMQSIVDANTLHDPGWPVKFFWIAPEENHPCGYEEFWNLACTLMRLCSTDSLPEKIPWVEPTYSERAGR